MNANGSSKKEPSQVQPQEVQAVTRLLERIRNINWELDLLHSEMQWGPDSMDARGLIGENAAAMQTLGHFKASLDRMRSAVWTCLEDAASRAGSDMEREKALRLERVTDLMRKLSPQPSVPAMTESGSFFERLNVVIDNYIPSKPLPRKIAKG